jgi:hypothetical protein
MPDPLRKKRQVVATAAGRLTEIVLARSIRARRGRLRSDLLDSPALRKRLASLVEASLSYSAALHAWREEQHASKKAGEHGKIAQDRKND